MSSNKPFGEINPAQQKEYERAARLQYDRETVKESYRRWNSYSAAQQEAIREEGNLIYAEIVTALEAGHDADSEPVQALLVRWHDHLRYFYEPTLDILRGLGELYTSSPDFMATFADLHPDLATFLQEGINHYVDELETAEIERMLAEDDARHRRLSQ